jgi:hypothetical protein
MGCVWRRYYSAGLRLMKWTALKDFRDDCRATLVGRVSVLFPSSTVVTFLASQPKSSPGVESYRLARLPGDSKILTWDSVLSRAGVWMMPLTLARVSTTTPHLDWA